LQKQYENHQEESAFSKLASLYHHFEKKAVKVLSSGINNQRRESMSSRSSANRGQIIFFSELLADRVENSPHAARFFLYLAGELDLRLYRNTGLGAPPYERVTLIAAIFYAMYSGHFESRKIVSFANDSIGAQWILNGMKMPGFITVWRTINELLEELDSVFTQILSLCEQHGLIGGELVYIDGVKVQASASKHKAMSYEYLGKKIARRREELKELFAALSEIVDDAELIEGFDAIVIEGAVEAHRCLEKIHQDMLAQRQEMIFNLDCKESAGQDQAQSEEERRLDELRAGLRVLAHIEPEKHGGAVEILNDIGFAHKRVSRMEEAKSELEERWKAANGDTKIPDGQQINFTDPDSSIMTTKHFGVQQCYNHFAIVDAKANIILGCYTSNNPVDQVSLEPSVERTEELYGSLEGARFGADAGFFSAGNIIYAEGKGIDFYASYPEADWPYAKDKFKYDAEADTYICPGGQALTPPKGNRGGKTREYCNEDACASCIYQKDCTKAKDGIRRINRDMENDRIREEAREKAESAEGREILRLRKSVPEPVWGNIKTQDDFIQMHYRGIEKCGREWMLHCVVQNMRKLLKVYFKSKSHQDAVHSKGGECNKVA
jgi:transposase